MTEDTTLYVGVKTNCSARDIEESFTVYGPWTREDANDRALLVVCREWDFEIESTREEIHPVGGKIQYVKCKDEEHELEVHFDTDGNVMYVSIWDGEEYLAIEAINEG
jgi:hypothetical protein